MITCKYCGSRPDNYILLDGKIICIPCAVFVKGVTISDHEIRPANRLKDLLNKRKERVQDVLSTQT